MSDKWWVVVPVGAVLDSIDTIDGHAVFVHFADRWIVDLWDDTARRVRPDHSWSSPENADIADARHDLETTYDDRGEP